MQDTNTFKTLLDEQLTRIIDATKVHRFSWQQADTFENAYVLIFAGIALRLVDLRTFAKDHVLLEVRFREQRAKGYSPRHIIYNSFEYPSLIDLADVVIAYLPPVRDSEPAVFPSVIDALSSLVD